MNFSLNRPQQRTLVGAPLLRLRFLSDWRTRRWLSTAVVGLHLATR